MCLNDAHDVPRESLIKLRSLVICVSEKSWNVIGDVQNAARGRKRHTLKMKDYDINYLGRLYCGLVLSERPKNKRKRCGRSRVAPSNGMRRFYYIS